MPEHDDIHDVNTMVKELVSSDPTRPAVRFIYVSFDKAVFDAAEDVEQLLKDGLALLDRHMDDAGAEGTRELHMVMIERQDPRRRTDA